MPFMISGGSRPPVVYKFIDGGYLRTQVSKVAKKFEDWFPLDYSMLELHRVAGGARKTFYYDCIDDIQRQGEAEQDFRDRIDAQEQVLKAFRRQPGCHVRLGKLKGQVPRQKEVDILIAVDSLTHAARGNFEKATIVTGDLDFRPLIKALVGFGIDVTLRSYTKTVSEEMIESADSFGEFSASHIFRWLNPVSKEAMGLPHVSGGGNAPQGTFVKNLGNWKILETPGRRTRYCATWSVDSEPSNTRHLRHDNLGLLEAYVENCEK